MDRAEELESSVDVGIARFRRRHRRQSSSAAHNRADHRRRRRAARYRMMALHEPQRTDFSRKPVTRIITPRRVLLQCENTGLLRTRQMRLLRPRRRSDSTRRRPNERARDVGCLRPRLRQRRAKIRSSMSRQVAQTTYENGALAPLRPDNKMRTTFGGNAGSSRTSSRSSMKCVQESAAMRAKLFGPRVFEEYVGRRMPNSPSTSRLPSSSCARRRAN